MAIVSAAPTVAARLLGAERTLLESLRNASAASPRPLYSLGWLEERRLRRLIRAGAVVEPSPGRYYLDEAALSAYLERRQRRVLVAVVLAVLTVLGLAGARRS